MTYALTYWVSGINPSWRMGGIDLAISDISARIEFIRKSNYFIGADVTREDDKEFRYSDRSEWTLEIYKEVDSLAERSVILVTSEDETLLEAIVGLAGLPFEKSKIEIWLK